MENEQLSKLSTDYNSSNEDNKISAGKSSTEDQSFCDISSPCSSKISDRDLKKERKRMLNRKAAARLRQKKKKEVKDLQDSNKNLKIEIEQMECNIIQLRQQIMEFEIEDE